MPQDRSPEPQIDPAETEALQFPVGDRGRLYAIPTSRFKTARLSLVTVLPVTRRTAVMAPLLLSVLTQGCEGYPSFEAICCRSDELWGSLIRAQDFTFGERRIFGLSISLIDPAYLPGETALFPDLIDLLRRILFCPLTDENGLLRSDLVEKAKQRQCDEIESLVSSPRRYAGERSEAFFYGDRPAGIPENGSLEETRAVTPAELTAFWKDWRRTAFFSFFYIGASAPETVAAILQTAFGAICAGKAKRIPPIVTVPHPVSAARVRRKEEPFPIEQGHLILGFQTGGYTESARRKAALMLANELLGASPVSFLFMNVREKKSLCYAVSSYYSRFNSSLFVKCALDPKNRKTAEREILRQIERLKKGDFSDAELEAARKSLVFSYRTVSDSSELLERVLLRRTLTHEKRSPGETIAAIRAVTRRQIVAAANLLSQETVYFLRGTAKGGTTDEI